MVDFARDVLGVNKQSNIANGKGDETEVIAVAFEAAEAEKDFVITMAGFEMYDRAVEVLDKAAKHDADAIVKGFESEAHEYDRTVVAVASILGIDQDTVYAIESEGGDKSFLQKMKDSIVNFIKKIIDAIKNFFMSVYKWIRKLAGKTTSKKLGDLVKKLEEEKRTKLDGEFNVDTAEAIAKRMPAVYKANGKLDGAIVNDTYKVYGEVLGVIKELKPSDLFKDIKDAEGLKKAIDDVLNKVNGKFKNADKVAENCIAYINDVALIKEENENGISLKEIKPECEDCENVEPIKFDELKKLAEIVKNNEKLAESVLKNGEKKVKELESEADKAIKEIENDNNKDAINNIKNTVKLISGILFFGAKAAKNAHIDLALEKYVNESVKLYKSEENSKQG